MIDGTMAEDGTGERYVTDGQLVGLKTDQHVTLVAGSRSGKPLDCAPAYIRNLRYAKAFQCAEPRDEIDEEWWA